MKHKDEFVNVFLEEAHELLDRMEEILLSSEYAQFTHDDYEELFRIIHTIKGSAAMFSFDAMSEFAHEVETYLSQFRNESTTRPSSLISDLLTSHDYLNALLAEKEHACVSLEMRAFLDRLLEKAEVNELAYYIYFAPHETIFKTGVNVVSLFNELRELGDLTIIPDCTFIPVISELDCESCMMSWELFLTTNVDLLRIRDVFIFVEDNCELRIESLTDQVISFDYAHKRLGDILVERGKIDPSVIDNIQKKSKKIGEILIEHELVKPKDIESALVEQKILCDIAKKKKPESDTGTIRVQSDKLDEMLDLVGELVTIEARLRDTARKHDSNGEISSVTEQYSRILDELRGTAMRMRMIPISTSLGSLKRMVRDLAIELEKKIDFKVEGEETEVDKKLIENLSDPLMHILRNCVDHGIEKPDVRFERGKNEVGTITLAAQHVGSHIVITITDDGNGLNTERIRAKAIEKGFIDEADTLSDQEIQHLIFMSGFSTADRVSNVSGRGVGMDVVAKKLMQIGGGVEIESEYEKYTRLTIKIPLTLAIIDGLQVHVGTEQYVVPLIHVESCIERTTGEIGDTLIALNGSLVSCIDLHEKFAPHLCRGDREYVVFVRYEERVAGLLVDKISGGIQAVVKPLGSLYKSAEGLSGATICGDGSIALILDVASIIKKVS